MITERCPPPDWREHDEIDALETSRVALRERVEYLMAVAAGIGDSGLTPKEATRLERLCRELELPDVEAQRVLAAAREPGRSGRRP